MVKCCMGKVWEPGLPRDTRRFALWIAELNWERTVDVDITAIGENNAAYYALCLMMEECHARGIEEVEFVGGFPKLWTRLRRMQKEQMKNGEYCSRRLHSLLVRFKQARFTKM